MYELSDFLLCLLQALSPRPDPQNQRVSSISCQEERSRQHRQDPVHKIHEDRNNGQDNTGNPHTFILIIDP